MGEYNEQGFQKKPKKTKKRILSIALVVALFAGTNVGSLYLGSRYINFGSNAVVAENKDANFEKLDYVKALLDKFYLEGSNKDKMLDGALKGMTEALGDPYTVYLTPDEFKGYTNQTEGKYEGVGIQVGIKDEKITVITAFEGSPAKAAGIQTDDVIQSVDGVTVTGKDSEKAVSMMRGNAGEKVKLGIYREGKGLFEVELTRAKIDMITVLGQMDNSKVGYIQITQFDGKTAEEFKAKLDELKAKGMKGLVLDLRGNPGGLLSSCVDVANNFLEKGKTVVSTKDKYDKETIYKTDKKGEYIGLPLVVLTDGGTASASEIVSGAVRDYKLGTIIGTKTFGKGIVQQLIPLKDESGLKVTVSKYYTPNGENIHKLGISPNIEVKYPDELKDKKYDKNADPQYQKALEELNKKMN